MTVSSHKVGTWQSMALSGCVALQALDELGCEVGDGESRNSDEMRERRREKECPERRMARDKKSQNNGRKSPADDEGSVGYLAMFYLVPCIL